jgi:hypothetical protein
MTLNKGAKKVMPISPGRPKGSPNKTTKAVKDVISEAADALGGVDRLVSWAREDALNERSFWSTIYPKLLPLQLSGDPDNPIRHKIEFAIVDPDPKG